MLGPKLLRKTVQKQMYYTISDFNLFLDPLWGASCDVGAHFWIPSVCLMSEVHTCAEHVAHADVRHIHSPALR